MKKNKTKKTEISFRLFFVDTPCQRIMPKAFQARRSLACLDTQARSELIFGTAYGGEMITLFISRKLEARFACLDAQARSELIFGTAYGGEMITLFISRKLEARSACLCSLPRLWRDACEVNYYIEGLAAAGDVYRDRAAWAGGEHGIKNVEGARDFGRATLVTRLDGNAV